ncbi:MAG: hypothetical protein LQ346_002701 [Caloplaca aetnensis]|nr:MAG: hypothetical protein LQ346_002701 [Caloplaca aetnensis]
MAKTVGQKRQAAQASMDSEEGARRTRSKVMNEESETTVTHSKRATRSSDQSGSSSLSVETVIAKSNGYGSSPANKNGTQGIDITPASALPKRKFVKKGTAQKVASSRKTTKPKVTKRTSESLRNARSVARAATKAAHRHSSSSLSEVSIPVREKKTEVAKDEASEDDESDGPSYWLMKAEPDSRIEKGKDVRFSIDDLKDATEPEAWDGVRNAVARNNMRAMMTGDMVFFYHSNCKKPGIAGTMEIVREHSVDETAFDPEHPYYDAKSTREKPKWCVVHVEFRRKFPELVTLKELQRFAKPGGVLENMQTLRITRLSVSKVTRKEWDFIHTLVVTDDEHAATPD